MSEFLSENFQFLVVKYSIHLNMRVFVMRYFMVFLPNQYCIILEYIQNGKIEEYIQGSVTETQNKTKQLKQSRRR